MLGAPTRSAAEPKRTAAFCLIAPKVRWITRPRSNTPLPLPPPVAETVTFGGSMAMICCARPSVSAMKSTRWLRSRTEGGWTSSFVNE